MAVTEDYGTSGAGFYAVAETGEHGTANVCDFGIAKAENHGVATAGYHGTAISGNFGIAISKGESETGENGLSVARGDNAKVKGGLGALLVILEEHNSTYEIENYKCAIVDGENIAPEHWYQLINGKFVEVEE